MSLAFVFPGQGSQSQGMLGELAEHCPEIETTFKEASDALGYDMWNIVQNGPEEKLNSTDVTQPAMLAAGVAVWRVWLAQGGEKPAILAGHSLGEYTALVCAESMAFADAINLVAQRGRFMQQAVPSGEGAMAAILGMEDEAVRQTCSEAANGDVVQAVNYNSPGQVVIAGQKAAVERAVEQAKQNGAKRAVLLPVSVPSHCSLMQPAAEQLAEVLAMVAIQAPVIPVINNVDVEVSTDADAIRDALVRQLYSPVRWVETIETMKSKNVTRLIECGPGKVLVGLNKRIDKSIDALAVFDSASLAKAMES